MQCPQCNQELVTGDVPFLWLERYGGDQCVATTDCCGQAVVLTMQRTYHVQPYVGPRCVDDWNRPFKSAKQPVSQTPA